VKPTLIKGAGGIFDVQVDDTPVWSKHQTGRFPDDNEVLDKIESLRRKAT
jgi:selenoprotein W-related protein